MFVRRRGCRLQVIRSYRDEQGKPRHETVGVVGVFDKKISRDVSQNITRSEMIWLRSEIDTEASKVIAESRAALKALAARSEEITDAQLSEPTVYAALVKLANI